MTLAYHGTKQTTIESLIENPIVFQTHLENLSEGLTVGNPLRLLSPYDICYLTYANIQYCQKNRHNIDNAMGTADKITTSFFSWLIRNIQPQLKNFENLIFNPEQNKVLVHLVYTVCGQHRAITEVVESGKLASLIQFLMTWANTIIDTAGSSIAATVIDDYANAAENQDDHEAITIPEPIRKLNRLIKENEAKIKRITLAQEKQIREVHGRPNHGTRTAANLRYTQEVYKKSLLELQSTQKIFEISRIVQTTEWDENKGIALAYIITANAVLYILKTIETACKAQANSNMIKDVARALRCVKPEELINAIEKCLSVQSAAIKTMQNNEGDQSVPLAALETARNSQYNQDELTEVPIETIQNNEGDQSVQSATIETALNNQHDQDELTEVPSAVPLSRFTSTGIETIQNNERAQDARSAIIEVVQNNQHDPSEPEKLWHFYNAVCQDKEACQAFITCIKPIHAIGAVITPGIEHTMDKALNMICDNLKTLFSTLTAPTRKITQAKMAELSPIESIILIKLALGEDWLIHAFQSIARYFGQLLTAQSIDQRRDKEWYQRLKRMFESKDTAIRLPQQLIKQINMLLLVIDELPHNIQNNENIETTCEQLTAQFGKPDIENLTWKELLYALRTGSLHGLQIIHNLLNYIRRSAIPSAINIINEYTDNKAHLHLKNNDFFEIMETISRFNGAIITAVTSIGGIIRSIAFAISQHTKTPETYRAANVISQCIADNLQRADSPDTINDFIRVFSRECIRNPEFLTTILLMLHITLCCACFTVMCCVAVMTRRFSFELTKPLQQTLVSTTWLTFLVLFGGLSLMSTSVKIAFSATKNFPKVIGMSALVGSGLLTLIYFADRFTFRFIPWFVNCALSVLQYGIANLTLCSQVLSTWLTSISSSTYGPTAVALFTIMTSALILSRYKTQILQLKTPTSQRKTTNAGELVAQRAPTTPKKKGKTPTKWESPLSWLPQGHAT